MVAGLCPPGSGGGEAPGGAGKGRLGIARCDQTKNKAYLFYFCEKRLQFNWEIFCFIVFPFKSCPGMFLYNFEFFMCYIIFIHKGHNCRTVAAFVAWTVLGDLIYFT